MAGPRQVKAKTGAAGLKGTRVLIVEARYYDGIADMCCRVSSACWTRPVQATRS